MQTSWEPEEHLPPELITLFQQQNPQLFEQRVSAASADGSIVAPEDWPEQDDAAVVIDEGYRTQYTPVQVKVKVPIATSASQEALEPANVS